jgi:hypothetical protein
MQWQHVVLICVALGAAAACGMTNTCHDMLPAMKDLALAVVSGVMGNAMRTQPQSSPHQPGQVNGQ